jgi:hypothetical protein
VNVTSWNDGGIDCSCPDGREREEGKIGSNQLLLLLPRTI